MSLLSQLLRIASLAERREVSQTRLCKITAQQCGPAIGKPVIQFPAEPNRKSFIVYPVLGVTTVQVFVPSLSIECAFSLQLTEMPMILDRNTHNDLILNAVRFECPGASDMTIIEQVYIN